MVTQCSYLTLRLEPCAVPTKITALCAMLFAAFTSLSVPISSTIKAYKKWGQFQIDAQICYIGTLRFLRLCSNQLK